jgi:hypothetical protein
MLGWRKSETIGRVALVGTAILGLGRVAIAEPEGVRIDYAAPTGCPDATAFVRSLRERTTRFREAAPDERARRFLVRVQAVDSAFSGRLEIQSPDGPTAVRNVEATVCDEVSSALALITALTIDPNALTDSPKRASKSQAEPPPGPAAGPPDRQQSSPSAAAVATLPPSGASEPSRPWRWSVGLLGHTTFLVSPNLGYGGDLFIEAEAPVSSRLGPAVRMGIFLNQSDVELPTGAAARFQWALVEVEGCPVRLGGRRFALHPCLAFRLGVIHGEGRGISQPKQTLSLWSDAGPELRLRLAVTARLLLEAQGGIMMPISRPTFDIVDMGSPTTVYSVPALGGWAGIGVAYRFR